ncbi:hypothetical protein SAMN04515620_15017 [Collimonas sp. OK607]|uniref:GIY-YIG nuclease family protein n=1 Tax=Collimonas sp. OK607 TaxID=1798194 RepID=UPI0008F4477F|nr:GIY-YIG nuclease family protein [Collimonas sp. OK607]SFB35856.1 hypothetical protein SAMN04515620_15017 [Collimonas sp. OK607]
MPINLAKLQDAGFEPAGKWILTQQGLGLELNDVIGNKKDVLYAFAVDGALRYVGKTASTLRSRLQGYKTPPVTANSGASTNIKNHQNIVAALKQGSTVDIYALHALPSQEHCGFAVSLAAGLEGSLIKDMTPLWNGRVLTQIRDSLTPPKNSSAISHSAEKPVQKNASLQGKADAGNHDVGVSEIPSAETLFAFARSQKGETFLTQRDKSPFRVEVVGNYLEVTPESSLTHRRESRDSVAAVLVRLAKTASFKMSDYKDLSFNASYVLALVKRWDAS